MITDRKLEHLLICENYDVEFRYKVYNVYNKESEGGMRYDAPEVNVDWGTLLNGITPVLSKKDEEGPTLTEANNQFVYDEQKGIK